MSATKVFAGAIALGVVGRWANNKKALPSITGSLEVLGALALVSVLDRGKTEPIANGLAWLFLAAILLSDSSPLTGLAKAEGAASNAAGGAKAPISASNPLPIGGTVLPPSEVNSYGGSPAAYTTTGTGYTARAVNTQRRVA